MRHWRDLKVEQNQQQHILRYKVNLHRPDLSGKWVDGMTQRQKNIAEYMTAHSNNTFSGYNVAIIESALSSYRRSRKGSGRKKADFDKNNNLLSEQLDGIFSPADLKLYKKCVRMEYENRTGKPAFSFSSYKERNGFV